MRKKFALLMAAFILTISTSFANLKDSRVPESVISEFSQHFYQAQNVNWEKIDNYYKVTFNLLGKTLFAFYTEDKDLMGIANYITAASLPVSLQSVIKNSYGEYWITDLFKFCINEETGYSVTLENADQKIILRSDAGQKWHIYKTVKKSES